MLGADVNLTSTRSEEPTGTPEAPFVSFEDLQRAATLFLEAARLTLQGERAAVEDCSKRAIDLLARNPAMLWAHGFRHDGSARVDPTGLDARSTRVLLYIESNLSNHLKIEHLANYFGFSETYFNVWFKSRFHTPPKTYIRARRIELAKSLMLGTPMPLSEIALSCGMADQAHFTRLFRRTVGETPGKWRSLWTQLSGLLPRAQLPEGQRPALLADHTLARPPV